MGREEAGKYYASREWALKKRAVRERSGGTCERCHNVPAEECHHINYARFGGRELLTDLLDVCAECHDYLHGRREWYCEPCSERLQDAK